MKLSLKMVIIKFNMQLRYAMLLLPLVLVGAGCVEGMVRSSSDAFLDVGIDGMGVLMEEAPGLMDQVMDEVVVDSLVQSNGVWSYEGNTVSSADISFTTLFDTYVLLEPAANPHVIRLQNYDPLLDSISDSQFFFWVESGVETDQESFERFYDVVEDVEIDGRTWVLGLNSLEEKERPVQAYRYGSDDSAIEISVFASDALGLIAAEEIIHSLEFVE